MSGTFTFELVSPEKLMFSKDVAMVTVPGFKGEYGVLAGHAPMITDIRPGVIRIYENDDVTVNSRLFVVAGFAEVTHDRFTVLAEEVVPVSQLDGAALQREYDDLSSKMDSSETEEERDALLAKRDMVFAKLKALA